MEDKVYDVFYRIERVRFDSENDMKKRKLYKAHSF